MDKKLLNVSHPPHLHHEDSVRSIMADILIALIPAFIWGAYIFGLRAVTVTAVCVFSCVVCELLWCLVTRTPQTAGDLSAVVTGVLLAFTLPASVPLWMPAAGGAFAIIIIKKLFGGIGKNIFNSVAASRVFLSLFDGAEKYTVPFAPLPVFGDPSAETEFVSEAIYSLKDGIIPQISMFDMFIGNCVGGIGTVSALLILAGGLYLMARHVISFHIPLSLLTAAGLFAFVFPRNSFKEDYMVYHLLSGGIILCAVFIATDYSTSPMTTSGKIIFGAGCGIITMLLRYTGMEGIYIAVVIMNIFSRIIEEFTLPRPFGKFSAPKAKKE
ncbi:MAG: RnfABCDGE type electron transport complex subunit D [Clostridia bacterium]|nr:RnfABCDGE type electron transport complex subunit D [Clostridia bacterium]